LYSLDATRLGINNPSISITQVNLPSNLIPLTPQKSEVCVNSIETYKVKDINSIFLTNTNVTSSTSVSISSILNNS
jgi:hypothetical protein